MISLLVQLRTSLPPTPPDTDLNLSLNGTGTGAAGSADSAYTGMDPMVQTDSLLSTLPDFRIFGRLFDIVFLLAALGTALYRYIAHQVNAADDSGEIYQHR